MDFEEKFDGFVFVVDVKLRFDVFEVVVEDFRYEVLGFGIVLFLKSEKIFLIFLVFCVDDKEGDILWIGGDVEDYSIFSLGMVDLCSCENEYIKLKLVIMFEVLEV